MKAPNKAITLMTQQSFEEAVKDYERFGHMVRILDHVFIDRSDRRITRPMILRALRKGNLKDAPAWDADHTNWTGEMHYLGTGVDLTVVCALKEGVLVVTVITVYGRPTA